MPLVEDPLADETAHAAEAARLTSQINLRTHKNNANARGYGAPQASEEIQRETIVKLTSTLDRWLPVPVRSVTQSPSPTFAAALHAQL